MNNINFNQTGGFPLETDTLKFLQDAYGSLSALAGLGGQNYILSGCEVNAGNIANGVIVIAGEILPFVGGPKLARVIIEETVQDKTFQDGLSKPTLYTRVARTAAAGGVIDFDVLKRVPNIIDVSNSIIGQSSALWTPVSTNSLTPLSSADGLIFRSGKLVVLSGNFLVTYTNSGSQNGVTIAGYPALGGSFNFPQHGLCRVTNPDGSNPEIANIWKNPGVNNLDFLFPIPSGVMKSVTFSITIILQ